MGGIPNPLIASLPRVAMGLQPWTRSGLSWSTSEPKTQMINGRYTIARILFLLVFTGCLTGVDAVNLRNCGARLQAAQQGTWNATNSTSPPPALRLTYEECVVECGGGIGDIEWEAFSQTFGAWFLPWIALMFHSLWGRM